VNNRDNSQNLIKIIIKDVILLINVLFIIKLMEMIMIENFLESTWKYIVHFECINIVLEMWLG
jgi:hypothetical protein